MIAKKHDVLFIVLCVVICMATSLAMLASIQFIISRIPTMRDQQPPAVQRSVPPATVPPATNEPAPSQVDFEDMAGLDAATQRLLNERYQGQGPGDFEKRLRRLEMAVSALTDRVFGKSLLPGESGQIGELGSDSVSPTTDK